MRFRTVSGALLVAAAAALGGCGGLGASATPTATPSAAPGPGGSGWMVLASGSATPSPVVTYTGTRPPVLPSVSFLATPSGDPCPATQWTVDPVEIPLTVTTGTGSLTISWPRQATATSYRVAAIPQRLISGAQPDYTWQDVTPGTGCTVTATIAGLQSGAPYVVWLDAPNAGHQWDGSRHPYSGKSGVVRPN
ncbi:hypothetical protein [Mangrovihabitans endophyticus]|uniref:Fibronectin type-III domain-containing protein n=1 Tax=Mangrovihabitans endophyticus TaxID=1751298 RepID=A0A8J3C2K5_9ACTN|nr:hypothetical protein [Mangrovihabitans endophyticus]GGK98248.1 hypothetical protein GCM10012284_35610 [Mangrovihabitans endophyticus]